MKRMLLIILLTVLLLTSAASVDVLAEETASVTTNGNELRPTEAKELKPGDKIKVDGNYSISFIPGMVLSDDMIKSRNHFSYLTSKENDVPVSVHLFPIGTHTPGAIGIELTNRSKEDTNWLKRVKCVLVYDGQYTYETMALQHNPNQTNQNKWDNIASTVAVDTEPLVSVEVSFLFSVPFIVRDSVESFVAIISLDDDVYAVDLRHNLQVIEH